MKTFYSILSAVINPISAEKISLGLLLSDGNRSFFDYSSSRLSLVSSLLDKESKKFIRQYLKSIDSVISSIDINQKQTTILDEVGKNLIINEPYIGYLSVYSQNVISFSKPVSIDVNVEESVFEELFTKFIDDETVLEQSQKSHIQVVKTEFLPRVKNHFCIEKELTSENFSSFLLPVTIDLYGKNEKYVIGQFFDLEKNIYHIKNDYFDYHQMVDVLETSKKFFISSEPQKTKYPQQHDFWNGMRKQNKHTYIHISEIEKIEEYAKKHNVLPA